MRSERQLNGSAGDNVNLARREPSPPLLESDNESISDETSIVTDEMSVYEDASLPDQPLGSAHPAFPSNMTNEQGRAPLSTAALTLNDIAFAPHLASTTERDNFERFLDTSNDAWTPYSPTRAGHSVTRRNLVPDKLQQALDGLEAFAKEGEDIVAQPVNRHYALEAWLESEVDPWTPFTARRLVSTTGLGN